MNHNKSINTIVIRKNIALLEQQENLKAENAQRKLAERDLSISILQKENLLTEIHHRVKNNMAVISSLLELQIVFCSDENSKEIIRETRNRIKAIALVHEELYKDPYATEINMSDAVNELLKYSFQALNLKEKHVEIVANIQSFNLQMNQALPLVLILNELIVNSTIRKLINCPKKEIEVELMKSNNLAKLVFKSEAFFQAKNKKENTFNIDLIEVLVGQLNGRCNFDALNYTCTIEFEI